MGALDKIPRFILNMIEGAFVVWTLGFALGHGRGSSDSKGLGRPICAKRRHRYSRMSFPSRKDEFHAFLRPIPSRYKSVSSTLRYP